MDLNPIGSNSLLSGGLVLMFVGALYYLKQLPGRLYNFFERFFIVKMEILDEDQSYHWMQVWLAERLRHTRSVSVVTNRSRPDDPDEDEDVSDKQGLRT